MSKFNKDMDNKLQSFHQATMSSFGEMATELNKQLSERMDSLETEVMHLKR